MGVAKTKNCGFQKETAVKVAHHANTWAFKCNPDNINKSHSLSKTRKKYFKDKNKFFSRLLFPSKKFPLEGR